MRFGEAIRGLRQDQQMSQRELAAKVGVTFTYISKIENHKLDFGEYPSETMIHKLAEALDADETELLLLAEKVPPRIRQRVMERPEAFSQIAELDDMALDRLVEQIQPNGRKRAKRSR